MEPHLIPKVCHYHSKALRRTLFFFVGVLFARGADTIRMQGSDTMLPFGEKLAAWFSQKYPEIRFQVGALQQAGSFAAMASGDAEIVQSSRKVLPPEEVALREAQGKEYEELKVTTEIAGITVHKANPVKELSLFQLRQVLSGNAKNWSVVGGPNAPINIYGRDDTSGVGAFIEEEFKGDESISASAKILGNNVGVITAVSRDANGIGFRDVEGSLDPKVTYVAIKQSAKADGIAPTEVAIRKKRYKLTRPLYFYFATPPKGNLLRFAYWTLSPEGQLVVESVGYYPLTSGEREAGKQILEKRQ